MKKLVPLGITFALFIAAAPIAMADTYYITFSADGAKLTGDLTTGAANMPTVFSETKLRRSAADRGIAVLFISSELEEVIGMCDRVAVMKDGRLQQVDIGLRVLRQRPIHN